MSIAHWQHKSIALAAVALVMGCAGGGPPANALAPSDPESAVRAFLDAVSARSLLAMSELWGTSRGPAARRMNADELRKRLTVIQAYLEHESYEIVPLDPMIMPGRAGDVVVQARLTRMGCTPTVPFTVTRWGQSWLISNIDLAAAGNPGRPCPPPGS